MQPAGLKKNRSLLEKAPCSVNFEADVLAKIRKLAFQRGQTISSLVSDICRKWLDETFAPQKPKAKDER